MTTRVLSFYDLFLDADFKKAWLEGKSDVYNKMLYGVGVDVEKGYSVIDRLHRPLSSRDKVPVLGPMLEHYQRTDPAWLKSGYASVEDIIEATSDSFMRADLLSMNRQSNFTGNAIDKYGSNDVETGEEKCE
jgi:hypothetical protein